MRHAHLDRRKHDIPAQLPQGGIERRQATASQRETAPLRVLLVDDDELVANTALHILIGAGLEVTLARNGLECVRFFGCSKFDLVLMDGQMPLMDGFEAAKRLRQVEAADTAKSAVPIIAMTGQTLHGIRDKCFSAGMNDVLTKPYSEKALFATLAKWLPAACARFDSQPGAPV